VQFIQLVEFRSRTSANDLREALDAWLGASAGKRSLQMAVVAADRDQPDRYWELLEFASEEDANRAVELPETSAAYDHWTKLLDGEPTFHNLDVMQQFGGPTTPPVEAVAAGTPGAPTPGAG
jgi:hypothetical protein